MARRERASRRNDILRCFTELVAERGYDGVSLRDVADALGMSKGTILHHFGTKDRLLEELHAEYMNRRLAEARELLERFDDPVDQIRAIIYQLLVAEQDDRAATVAFAREIVRFSSEEVMAEVRSMRRQYSALVRDIIRRGIDEGVFADVDPTIASLHLFGMCNWSWTWFQADGTLTAEEIADEFSRTFLHGLIRRDVTDDLDRRGIAAAVTETMAATGEAAALSASPPRR
jgi:AcrR family transcriptional regulator